MEIWDRKEWELGMGKCGDMGWERIGIWDRKDGS